jgi:hypothetical protein
MSARHRTARDAADLDKLRAVPEGTPGAVPHTVTREVPVSIIARAGGQQEVVQHDAEACFGCACCIVWAVNLNTLADAIRHHDRTATDPDGYPNPEHDRAGCLVCQLIDGNLDAVGGVR